MKLATCPIMEGPHWPSSAARRRGRIERLIETGSKRKDKERPFQALISYRDATCSNSGGNRNRNRNGICGNYDSAGSCDSIDGWCATNNSSSSSASGCCTSGLNLIIQSGGLSDGPPCRPNNHNTEILIEKLSDTNRIKLTKMHRVVQSSQLRAKWCLGLMLTLVTLVAGLAPSISLGSAAAAVVVPVGSGRHQKAPLLPPTPAAILINLGNANNDTNSQKISLAQSEFKRSTLNDTTANQLLMTGRASGALFKTIQEPLSAALTTLSVATSSPKGALERQVTPAISSQPVDPMLTAASKKKKKKMMKKKKMEKKHKEWKKGKKHKKKKYESKKKKGGSSKKKKGKKEKKKWGMEKKGHKKKGNFKKKKWGSKKKMKKGHKKGKKGHKKLMDKGHKKKGFKKIYHKEEWGKKKKWHDIKREKKWNTKNKKWKKKWHQEKGKKYKGKHMKKYHKKNKHGKKYKKEKKSKWKKHKGEKFKKGHKKKKEEYSKKKEGGKKKKMKKMKEMKKKKKG